MKKHFLSQTNSTAKGPSYDVQLLLAVLFLVGIGMVMVYSASGALAMQKFHTDYYFLKRQSIFALLGTLVLIISSHIPYRLYRALAYPFLVISLFLLAAVHLPYLGTKAGGSKRWLDLGFIAFQPSETARLALIMYLAYSLEKKQELIKRFSIGILPHVMILFIFSLLLWTQPDFGSIVIYGAITWIMMFVGGVRIRYLISSLIPVGAFGFWVMLN
ncbi:MAG: FtsW/RodA/SpoVE family cell cycle protein, partial [Desulfobacteraceae bacterium]